MREKIAGWIEHLGYDKYGCADQIITLLKEKIEKSLLTYSEMRYYDGHPKEVLAQAQLDKILVLLRPKG